MSDYYSVLMQAIAALDPNTANARLAVYDRARRVLIEHLLRDDNLDLPASKPRAQRAAFENAVERIEAEFASRDKVARPGQRRQHKASRRPDAAKLDLVPRSATGLLLPAVLSMLGVAVVLVIAIVGYSFMSDRSTDVPRTETKQVADNRSVSHSAVTHAEELEPGVDGGSTDSGLPYYYRRQPIYYRTIYSVGSILIDRSQRFLYFVQPNSVALRYGIGVGGECVNTTGLLRVTRKDEWPEWVPSPELIKRKSSYPSRMAGGPSNPLGARMLYLNDADWNSWDQCAEINRSRRVVGLLPNGQQRRH